MDSKNIKALLACGLLSLAGISQAQTLGEIYNSAVDNDPQIRAAGAALKSQKSLTQQAQGALLPKLDFTYSKSHTNFENKASAGSPVTIIASSYGLSLSQPLFNASTWFNYKQVKAIDHKAELDFSASQQDLIIRVAVNYFNILRANDALIAAKTEEAAIKRQLEQTQQRFDVGLIAITDVHEAQAAFDLVQVGRIVAKNQLDIAYEALQAITGQQYTSISTLKEDYPITNPMPADPQAWADDALAGNFALKSIETLVVSARQGVKAKRAKHLPTVSLFGQYQVDDNDDASTIVFNNQAVPLSPTDQVSKTIGIKIKLPLYSGGMTMAASRQASYDLIQTQENLTMAQRSLVQQTRSLYSAVVADVQRIKARQQAIVSTQSALEATEVGYDVGTRNIVDVLQAQRGLYRSKRDYAAARYDYVIHKLQLKQATGQLSPADMSAINGWIDSSSNTQRRN
ncbi:MAG: TolC family outer membrane protein [Pseudomonadales bacterium]|nr:TolC family outer membrane protein [Pseudomonadales bacterium]